MMEFTVANKFTWTTSIDTNGDARLAINLIGSDDPKPRPVIELSSLHIDDLKSIRGSIDRTVKRYESKQPTD